MTRRKLPLLGVLMGLLGIVWLLQGLNILPGSSFMNGVSFWAYAGAALLIAGVIILVYGLFSRRTLH